MYEYINYVLSNYFSSNIGYSEEEAISHAKSEIKSNASLLDFIRADFERAFVDTSFSWLETLSEQEVYFADNEDDARSYVRRVIWANIIN